jgi:hypothetical protein
VIPLTIIEPAAIKGQHTAGFDTRDIGYGTLNAPAAAYLGIANILEGYRSDVDLTITVTTRTPDGLILPSRTVQIHWQKWNKSLLNDRAAAFPDG